MSRGTAGVSAGLLVAAAVLLTGCVYDEITLAAGSPRVAVHGVLNPGVTPQVVLVERALTGAFRPATLPFDSLDPILSGGGEPIRNARVVITGPTGDSVVLREDRVTRADGRGAGVYRFLNTDLPPGDATPSMVVEPGERYTLRVTTPEGEVVTGETLVPLAPGLVNRGLPLFFEREVDSIFIGWPDVARAARFEVRVETPNGPFTTFVDSLEYLVSGQLELPNATGRPRAFWPGFQQLITVSAVDANYHDYYRTGTDAFNGRGLLVRLEGGVGVFGSLARVRERAVNVIGANGPPPAGRWERVSGAGVPPTIRVWTESSAGGATRLSGNVLGTSPSTSPPVVADQFGARLTLAVLRGVSLRDTALAIDGQLTLGTDPTFTGIVRGTNVEVTYRIVP